VKRKLFIIIGTVLVLLLSTVSFALAQETVDSSVTESEAEKAAINQIERVEQKMDGWSNATLSKPVTYYAPDNTKSVYEFTVLNGDLEVGFIIVSARKDWMPVLEYSEGKAPSKRLDSIVEYAINKGFASKGDASKAKIIYWGAFSYSVQLGDQMKKDSTAIHLMTAQLMPTPKMAELQMDKDNAKAAWSKLLTETKFQTKGIDWVELSGVPLWYQHNDDEQTTCENNDWCCDRHSDNATAWPACAGEAADEWNNWDGCSCIAGAMLVAYDQYGISEDDETLIDDCHEFMDTDDNFLGVGITWPWNIDSGIEDVFDLYNETCDASNIYDVSWSEIQTEINADRPFILSTGEWDMSGWPWEWEWYSGHSQTGVGYEWDTSDPDHKMVWVHTTWDNPRTAVIAYGNWDDSCMTKVEVD